MGRVEDGGERDGGGNGIRKRVGCVGLKVSW